MKTLAWASFLTFGIPAPGSTGSATVAVAGVAAGSAAGGTGGWWASLPSGNFALKVDIGTIGGEYGLPAGFSLSPGIARQRASRTLPV